MKYLVVMGMTALMLGSVVLAADATPGGRRSEVRQEVREVKDRMRVKFEEKIKTIRDEKKKQIVEHADAKIAEINKRRTDAMLDQLNKMSEILVKAKARGADTAAAEAAIASAKTAVVAQAGKTYTVEITTEDKLKVKVGEAMKALKTDLQAVHQKVVDARKATADAIRSVRPTPKPTP